MSREPGLDLSSNYLHIESGGVAVPIAVTPTFWSELISRENMGEGAARVARGGGWLVVKMRMETTPPHWEMHPAGDEILLVVSGALDVHIEEEDGVRIVEAGAGTACLVPRGRWHRAHVGEPAELVAMTYGEGTQHRPG